ncbi:MAG: nuclear transport factor 2 family protein [Vicinamibacteria bacterium]|jgi:hypothetical protein|nr:nuclear transport factor 2 family protein [Vicinamibacteria bacterium]
MLKKNTIMGLLLVMGMMPLAAAACEKSAPMSAAQKSAIEKAVTAAHDRLLQAARELKADANLEMMIDTDKGAMIYGGRMYATRAEATAAIRAAYAGVKTQTVIVVTRHVNVLSATSAIVVAEVQGEATTIDDRNLSARTLQSVVFVLVDGQWKVAHAHQSLVRP